MTVHEFDAQALGYAVGVPDGKIEAKFAAIGDHVAIGHFRHHRELIAALIAGPCNHLPLDLHVAADYVLEHNIPTTFGNILADGTIAILADDDHRVNVSSAHADTVRLALSHFYNRAA